MGGSYQTKTRCRPVRGGCEYACYQNLVEQSRRKNKEINVSGLGGNQEIDKKNNREGKNRRYDKRGKNER